MLVVVNLAGGRIAIFLPDLRPGGAELLHVRLANEWLEQGIEVDFVLRNACGELLSQLSAQARIFDLKARRVRDGLIPLTRYLRFAQPDTLLAAMWPLTVIAPFAACLARFRGRVVVSEHAPQSLSYARRGKLHNLFMTASMRALYPLADARVAVSAGVACDMAQLTGMPRERFTVIHNPAASGRIVKRGQHPPPIVLGAGPLILSVGTLKAVKRQDLLIRAFSRVEARDARLCILGEGPERERLEALVVELGLEGRVSLPGYQSDTAPWYANSDLFVLSSEYEGFGNVIVEALEQGTPVVSTDCPVGPGEILAGGEYGTLVPLGDTEALARAIDRSLTLDHDREALKRRAREFSMNKAATAYLELLLPDWRKQLEA